MSATSGSQRRARLFRNGANQAVRIPREFELPGDEVFIRAEKGTLILEPVSPGRGLLRLLSKWKPIADAFPDVDEGVGRDDDIEL